MVKVIRRVRFAPKLPSISSTLIQTPCSRNHSNLKKQKDYMVFRVNCIFSKNCLVFEEYFQRYVGSHRRTERGGDTPSPPLLGHFEFLLSFSVRPWLQLV